MTITDLQRELADQAADLPDLAAVRADVDRRAAVRIKHRRTRALIAVAAAVVLVAGGAGIATAVLTDRGARPADPTPPEPVVQVPDVPLPDDSPLIRHHLQPMISPVTAAPPEGLTSQVWLSEPGAVAVSFYNPHPAGVARATASYSPVDPTSQSAGYVVTDRRSDPLTAPGRQTAPTVSRSTTTVSGHLATVDTAPPGTTDRFGLPAQRRITWKLTNGQWIHVWAKGFDDARQVNSFAARITEKPRTLDRALGIGLTLPGLLSDSSINMWPSAISRSEYLYLCPAGVDPIGPSSGSASGYASLNSDGSTTTHQTETTVDPSAPCITATVVKVPAQQRDSIGDGTTAVTVGGTVAHVSAQQNAAWAYLDAEVIAVVRAPAATHLPVADLAALVASVRLAPGVTVTAPDAEGSTSQSSGSRSAGMAPSTLPTARTMISGTSDLTSGPVAPITAPISITADQQYIRAEWQVFTGSGSIAVSHRVGPNGGPNFGMGIVIYRSSGLENVPPSATNTTVDGHPAKMWNDGGKIGWTLPDGTGLTVTTGVEKDSRTLAGWIEAKPHAVSVGMEPAITPAGWTVTSAYVAGSHDGTGTLQLCPADPGEMNSRCVNLRRIGADTTPGEPLVDADWQVATVDSQAVYVSPDRLQMAVHSPSGAWTTIEAGASSGLSAADLAAILLSVPE